MADGYGGVGRAGRGDAMARVHGEVEVVWEELQSPKIVARAHNLMPHPHRPPPRQRAPPLPPTEEPGALPLAIRWWPPMLPPFQLLSQLLALQVPLPVAIGCAGLKYHFMTTHRYLLMSVRVFARVLAAKMGTLIKYYCPLPNHYRRQHRSTSIRNNRHRGGHRRRQHQHQHHQQQ